MGGSPPRAQSWEDGERCRINMLAEWFWRALDALDYRVMQARMRIVDAIYGPKPETEADWQRGAIGRAGEAPGSASRRDSQPSR